MKTVAVHIDVGDYVEINGRVLEVKETNFDDHDVTMWFNDGSVIRCPAGVKINVVKRPEEDIEV